MKRVNRPIVGDDGFITWTGPTGITWDLHENGSGCSACRIEGGNPEDDFVFDLPKELYDAALIALTG
jgi:hypothetical protein